MKQFLLISDLKLERIQTKLSTLPVYKDFLDEPLEQLQPTALQEHLTLKKKPLKPTGSF